MHTRLFLATIFFVVRAGAVAEAQAQAPAPDAPRARVSAEAPAAGSRETVALDVSRAQRSRVLAGAGIGFVVGAGVTYAVLHSGGSTSLCDRSANQDAMAPRECLGLTALGGLAGAGVGAVIGARFRTGGRQGFSVGYRGAALAPLPARGVGLALAVAFR